MNLPEPGAPLTDRFIGLGINTIASAGNSSTPTCGSNAKLLLLVIYDDVRLNHDCFADIIVEHGVLLELKSIERILPVHRMQTLMCLRLSGCAVGLLMNFNGAMFKHGLRRFIP